MSVNAIGVIGGGIGGLAAAWILGQRYQVTLLERNDYIGGHTHTVDIPHAAGAAPVDTGFMVFNRRNYPLLCAMFDHLGVAAYPTSMSFAASLDGGRLEYAGTNLGTLFGQRSNLLNPAFIGMLLEILKFNKAAKAFAASDARITLTLGAFLERGRYSARFANQYLLPMAAAIWSCPTDGMRAFPFLAFARFFANHGLLDLVDRPDWETVRGGSRTYVARILERSRGVYRTGVEVKRVRRRTDAVEVETASGETLHFDALVMAAHADESLAMLETPTALERELLGCFAYRDNQVFLHSDPTLMPRRKRVWSSWNYLQEPGEDPTRPVTVTYWMNSLQDLPAGRDVFVSLNPLRPPRPETRIAEFRYAHPMFDVSAMAAQRRMAEIQGQDRIWYSGAWLGYGFHEDGLRAAVEVAAGLGVEPPWGTRTNPAAARVTAPPAAVGVPGAAGS